MGFAAYTPKEMEAGIKRLAQALREATRALGSVQGVNS